MNHEQLLESIPAMLAQVPDGWCTPERAKLLAETVYDNELTKCLCIGVYAGRSVLPVAAALRALEEGMIYCVDPWSPSASVAGMDKANAEWWGKLDHEAIYKKFIGALARFGLLQYASIERATNRKFYETIRGNTGKPFDYIEIDGNHGADDCNFDVDHFLPLLRKGGFLWYDDRFWAKEGYEKLAKYSMVERVVMDTGVLCQKE